MCCNATVITKLQVQKEVSECSAQLHSVKNGFHERFQGTVGAAGHLEKVAEQ